MARVKKQVLQEIVRRVVQAVQPEKIVLFGSAALGKMGPDSDIDLLVIKSGAHRRRAAQSIYLNLFGIGRGVDIIVVTPEDIEMYHSALGLIIGPALEQGKVVYERSSATHPTHYNLLFKGDFTHVLDCWTQKVSDNIGHW